MFSFKHLSISPILLLTINFFLFSNQIEISGDFAQDESTEYEILTVINAFKLINYVDIEIIKEKLKSEEVSELAKGSVDFSFTMLSDEIFYNEYEITSYKNDDFINPYQFLSGSKKCIKEENLYRYSIDCSLYNNEMRTDLYIDFTLNEDEEVINKEIRLNGIDLSQLIDIEEILLTYRN